MKTSKMRKTGNFFRKNQRVLAVSLLLASIYSCKKGVMEPSAENNMVEDTTLSVSTRAIGNLIYNETADLSSFSTYPKQHVATSYGLTASTAQYYNGTKSVRFELRDTDPEVQSGTRAEFSYPDATNMHRWYSYALYVPSAQFQYDSDDDVITQFHQGGGATPALCLRVRRDHLWIRVLGTWTDLGPFLKDKWHTYILHAKHSSGSDGLLEFWIDGVKVFTKSGANAYTVGSTYHMPNMKLGIYKSNWNGSGTTDTKIRVLYFDDIKIGNENATYNDMVPSGGTTTTPTEPAPTPTEPTPTPTPTSPTTSGQSVVSFTLVNSATEKDVITITDGQTISLSALGITKCNIRANTNPATLGSVKFELSGLQSKTSYDNKAPYALHGDDGNGNYYYGNWNPPALGTYTLKATPYTDDDLKGTVGTAKTITFTIKN
ncbi:hypothetical protein FAM09_12600 [Niastella caeni]|uniref:Polysaccharide lyase-like protein n=1 Tax=Niastella caeni TaxID=2569763 RepID=A0A4S8HYU8_9BACT|nr:polysaccharide lyase [Niastella caeni]THU39344.1 hypothetical protein FAM09_12600 [Niastella caeni]